ncbi:putative kinase involved in propanediol utilization [Halobacteroides halobius DSM 5150]|uniref:Putative kinase involved in propanediol utilization n=1 Tax=Halobacteroides halobius (strain ATCC 35273 / DSM 5150 / MD-1) TaxID=748449 RepID=L0K8M3_HALHC|nr:kinase involved in propanediol utilization [Halobacteroides halobius]AGB41637.1 putative kinase involved in propanediol utilization [Halobacteroides halobius DSM 5150]
MTQEVTVKVPGTCGELMQGIIDGVDLQISCPIDRYSYVTVKRDSSLSNIKINQAAAKTVLAIEKTLEYFNISDIGLQVSLKSELLAGKGMASSTADIVAGIIATMIILGAEVNIQLVRKIAISIEPTDACFLSGIVAFNHLQGQPLTNLGQIKSVPILIFDVGGGVDTIKFNARENLTKLKLEKEKKVRKAYQLIAQGINREDMRLIGKGTTISSLANQSILYKPQLKRLIKLARQEEEILGINIAHSGTLIGVILASEERVNSILARIRSQTPSLKYITRTRIINGGHQIMR